MLRRNWWRNNKSRIVFVLSIFLSIDEAAFLRQGNSSSVNDKIEGHLYIAIKEEIFAGE